VHATVDGTAIVRHRGATAGFASRLCHVYEEERSECLKWFSGKANFSAKRRTCEIIGNFRNLQAGDPGDVSTAHGGADSRQADTLLRASCRHDHGHRGRGWMHSFSFISYRICAPIAPVFLSFDD